MLLHSDSIFDDSLIIADERSSEDLAEVFYAERQTVSISIKEARANARLIAAAPELLEALKAVAAWKDAITVFAPELGGLLTAIYRAEAAIAKAEAAQ